MKRLILLMLVLITLFAGCRGSISDRSEEDRSTVMHKSEEDRSNFAQSVSILEVELAGINWEKIEFPISIDAEKIENYISEECINMEQSALTVGEYIIELWHEQGKLPAYSLHQIVHSTQDDIWRFDYLAGRKNPLDDYGGVYVAINGSTGKIIKAWIEEW